LIAIDVLAEGESTFSNDLGNHGELKHLPQRSVALAIGWVPINLNCAMWYWRFVRNEGELP
jgi:hypothetical protein